MDTIGARALAARKFAQLTQKQAEQASGVKQSDISKIERGETERPTGLLALARAYGVDPNWLDTGDGVAPWDADGAVNTPATMPAASPLRQVTESQWALLQDFEILPEDDKEALRSTMRNKAENVRKIVAEYLGRQGVSGTASDTRVAEFIVPAPRQVYKYVKKQR